MCQLVHWNYNLVLNQIKSRLIDITRIKTMLIGWLALVQFSSNNDFCLTLFSYSNHSHSPRLALWDMQIPKASWQWKKKSSKVNTLNLQIRQSIINLKKENDNLYLAFCRIWSTVFIHTRYTLFVVSSYSNGFDKCHIIYLFQIILVAKLELPRIFTFSF